MKKNALLLALTVVVCACTVAFAQSPNTVTILNQTGKPIYYARTPLGCNDTRCAISINDKTTYQSLYGTIKNGATKVFLSTVAENPVAVLKTDASQYTAAIGFSSKNIEAARAAQLSSETPENEKTYLIPMIRIVAEFWTNAESGLPVYKYGINGSYYDLCVSTSQNPDIITFNCLYS